MLEPHVTILLASYNGAKFIDAQLQSIANQSHKNWKLVISDDGSYDGTAIHINSFIRDNPLLDIEFVHGPKKGCKENFWHLLGYVDPRSNYVSFADQDDIWFPDKIQRAIQSLSKFKTPALYGARTLLVDADGKSIGESAKLIKTPSFSNALVQNVFAGNTTVINSAALDILCRSSGPGHLFDWYIYQLLSGAGAAMVFDEKPCLYYRQHGGNAIGANQGLRARIRRMAQMIFGTFQIWNTQNIQALANDFRLLTPKSQKRLFFFQLLRRVSGGAAIHLMRRGQFFRHGRLGQAGLWFAAIAGRL